MNGHAIAPDMTSENPDRDVEEQAAREASMPTPEQRQAVIDAATQRIRDAEKQHAALHVNGAHPQPDQTAVQKAEAVVDAQLRQVIGVTIRGILVSSPGFPSDVICRSIARVTGALLCDAVHADLALMLKHRAGIKDAFKAGVDSTKVNGGAAAVPAKR